MADVADNIEEFDQDDLKADIVVNKYKQAAEIANAALAMVTKACVPGATVLDLCQMGDKHIDEAANKLYAKQKPEEGQDPSVFLRGVSHPTSIGINHVSGSFSPLSDDKTVLKEGDMVKVDLGAHVHGYIAQVAHTLVVPKVNGTAVEVADVTGKRADAIVAAHQAAEAALRMLKPGHCNEDVTEMIATIAAEYGCSPVAGGMSHQVRCFAPDGGNVILNKADAEARVERGEFAEGDVYVIDIFMSTGEGKVKESGRTTVFKKDPENKYMLKLDSARWLFGQVSRKHATMPFTLRSLGDERKARVGVQECVKHDLLIPMPVLEEEEGQFIAQVKFTAMITSTMTDRITTPKLAPYVKSDKKVQDKKAIQVLNMGTRRMSASQKAKAKKKKTKAAPAAAAAKGEPMKK